MKLADYSLLALLLSSCATVGEMVLEKPQVTLKDVAIGKVSLDEMELNATLDVVNPNSFPLNLSAIDYQVDSMGMTLGKGSTLEALNLKPGVKQTIRLPLTLTTLSALKLGQAYASPAQKQLPVTLQATVTVTSPVGPLSLNFQDVKDLKEKAR